jgi:formiminoglutamate deiminase
MSRLWCEWAWLGGEHVESGVLIEIDGAQIGSVTAGVSSCPGDAERRAGVTIPGFVNAHSHVFHRALRARTHGGKRSFWAWRDQMYELAALLDPDTLHTLARATYGEMALAGITTVGEFHYVHHDTGGRRYGDPNAMSHAVIAAARDAGLRIVLIDACYLEGGIGRALEGVQLRFGDGSVHAWADRVDALDAGPHVQVAGAIHSVRAVSPMDMKEVARWAAERSAPLHAHVSEQPAENAACIDAYGATPTQLLHDAGALGADFTAVHAIHLDDPDVALLGGSTVCLCPTTERDLADGIASSGQLRDAGAMLTVGSDSNAVVDIFEEARGIELDTRLATGERGIHPAVELLAAATGGATLVPGAKADLVTIGVSSPRLAGTPINALLEALTFAATADDVTDVMVAGHEVVRDRAHISIDVAAELDRAVRAAWRER